jgi:hypothetical protein
LEEGQLTGKPVAVTDIVGIHSCDVLSARDIEPAVKAADNADIPLVPENHGGWVVSQAFIRNGGAPVCRAVIDHDNLEGLSELPRSGRNARQRLT